MFQFLRVLYFRLNQTIIYMKKSQVFSGLITLLIVFSCSSLKKTIKVDPYIGNWSLLIEDTPQGDIATNLVISIMADGSYSGILSSDMGSFELDDFEIIEQKLSAIFYYQQIDFDVTGTFKDMSFNGYVSGMGEDFRANGKKLIEE